MMPRNFLILYVAMVLLGSSTNAQDSMYLGCFYDTTNRVLPDLTSCSGLLPFCNNYCSNSVPYCQSSTNMSVSNCLSLCAAKSFVYAGVQAESQCFCGGPSAAYDQYGEEQNDDLCKSNCTGDVTQDCGNDYRMRVYEIGCLPFDSPQNSTLSPANENFFAIGRTLNISCQQGFFLSGPGDLKCLPLGEWNLPAPSCLPDVCMPPEAPSGSAARGNHSQERMEYSGGDNLVFDCNDANVTVDITCMKGEWHAADGVCPESTEIQSTEIQSTEIQPTEILTSIITEISTTEEEGPTLFVDRFTELETTVQTTTASSEATPQMTKRSGTTTDVKVTEFTALQATVVYADVTTSSDENTTLTSPTKSNRAQPVNMLWLAILVGAALFFFVIVLFFAVVIACRKKAKQDTPINFQNNSQMQRIEDMSQVNYAYETDSTDQPNQSDRQTSGSPIRISSLYSQQEITMENNNENHYEYAKPVTPAYTTNQSGTVPNEYASPVHHHNNNNREGKTSSSVYSPDIPEPDYDLARRESYVEVVTKL